MSLKIFVRDCAGFFRRMVGRGSVLGKKMASFNARNPYMSQIISLGVLAIFVITSAYIHFWAAPRSTGVDPAQFLSFAKVFQQHGLDFYRYADAYNSNFPAYGWGFVYPPVWLLLLRIALFTAPNSFGDTHTVDTSWRLAEKTPIIAADLMIGVLLYWAIPGSKWKKLFFSFLWLFHPTAWYNSAVFGQFDAIAALLLLAAVILMEKGFDRWAFGIAALSVLTKQHVFIPVLFIAAAGIQRLGRRRFLQDVGIFTGVVAVFSIPFVVTGNIIPYMKAVLLPGQTPEYQTPLMYTFSGGGAVFTYLNEAFGWNTLGVFKYFIPVLIIGTLVLLYFTYKKQLSPTRAALVGFLAFLVLNYRVNYQYLVIFIPLALLAAAYSRFKFERVFTVFMALVPAVWLWLFNLAFWFYYVKPEHLEVLPLMDRLGFFHMNIPDYAYVILAVGLMALFIVYIAMVFSRWGNPKFKELRPPQAT